MARDFVIAVIATRLHYSRANAAAIAEALSEEDREQIARAAKRSPQISEIAAVIYRARLRNAARLPRDQYLDAKSEAEREAKRHYLCVQAVPLPHRVDELPASGCVRSPRQVSLPAEVDSQDED